MSGEGLPDLTLREAEKDRDVDFSRVMIARGARAEDFFDCEYLTFQQNYAMLDPQDFPEEAYGDYRDLEDLFEMCSSPTRLNKIRMRGLREALHRYAEANR